MMNKNSATIRLKERIATLEVENKRDRQEFMHELMETYQSTRLVNIVRSSIQGLVESSELKEDITTIAKYQLTQLLFLRIAKIFKITEDSPLYDTVAGIVQLATYKTVDYLKESFFTLVEKFFGASAKESPAQEDN